ncbi:hypothetical protein ACOBV8_14880 [Pseudoalteromonas espejiana]
MIYRDRTSIAVPGSCDGQNSAASEELQKATAFYNNYVPGGKAYSFKVYKNADISRALHSLFKKNVLTVKVIILMYILQTLNTSDLKPEFKKKENKERLVLGTGG